MNLYKFHWADGTVDVMASETPEAAFNKLGYGAGAMRALDYYETFEVPKEENKITRALRTHLGGLAICVLQQDWEGATEMASQVEVTCKNGIKARLPWAEEK